MKCRAIGHRVLVKPISVAEDAKLPKGLQDSGFQIKAGLDKDADFRAESEINIGTIIALGPLAWKHRDFGFGVVSDEEWKEAWPKVGDKVFYLKYAGYFVGAGEQRVYIINDDDVKLIIEED
jgi:co-chaperonin GroES (HSP10)